MRNGIWSILIVVCISLLGCSRSGSTDVPTPTPTIDYSYPCSTITLINAINAANADPDPDTITLTRGCRYILTEVNNTTGGEGGNGFPAISTPITLNAPYTGHDIVNIERNNSTGTPAFRLFFVTEAGELTLIGGNYSNGWSSKGAGVYNEGVFNFERGAISSNRADSQGGGVYNLGTASLGGIGVINFNQAQNGGGIYNAGGVITFDSLGWLSGNIATEDGGGLYNDFGGDVRGNANIQNNIASQFGGGIFNFGYIELNNRGRLSYENEAHAGGFAWNRGILKLTNFAAWDNFAYDGGVLYNEGEAIIFKNSYFENTAVDTGAAIHNRGDLTITNTTISNNQTLSGIGPAIYNTGSLVIHHATIAENEGSSGGALFSPSGTVEIGNSIVAGNSGGDCSLPGTVILIGVNLNQDGSCPSFALTLDPALAPLANYGAPPLQAHDLLPGSPAIDAATGSCPASDQIGRPRPAGAACDIGAVEWVDTGAAPTSESATEPLATTDTFCYLGPGPNYDVVSTIISQTVVDIIGVGQLEGWLVIDNPIYQGVGCWVSLDDIDLGPDYDLGGVPIIPVPLIQQETEAPGEPDGEGGSGGSAPASPSNLQAETTCTNIYNVKLTWNDNSNNESGFRIYRDGALIGTVSSNITEFTDTNPADSSGHSYSILAHNESGNSASVAVGADGCIF